MIRKAATFAPHYASLAEFARWTGEKVSALRLRASRERLAAADLPELLTTGQAAFLLCFDRSVLKDLLRRGAIPATVEPDIRRPDRTRYVIRLAAIRTYAEEREQASRPQSARQ
jgi:hypothetical protein